MAEPVVEVRGLKDLKAALDKLEVAVRTQLLADGINAGAQVLALEMARRAPHRSGKLAQNIETTYSIAYGIADARVGPGRKVFYGGILNHGAKPHPIPKFRTRLRRWERAKGLTLKSINADKGPMAFNGHVYSRIKHPGITARPFMSTAVAVSDARCAEAMGRAMWVGIDRLAASVSKGQN